MLLRVVAIFAGLSVAACATPTIDRHDIPFRYISNQIVLDARIKGAGPFNLLLDTGVTPSAIDIETARQLGLPLDESDATDAQGAGTGGAQVLPSRIVALELGGVAYGDLDAAAFSMAGLSRRLGEPLHGVLGDAFFAGRVVTIDYPRGVVSVGGSAPDADAPGIYQFPLVTAPDDIMPLMQVRVAGRPLVVSMDTGSSFGLELYREQLGELGLTGIDANWEASAAAGARGAFETRRGTLPRVELGPFVLTDVAGVTSARPDERHRAGNAGNALLRSFVVTFDYGGRTVTLRRAAD